MSTIIKNLPCAKLCEKHFKNINSLICTAILRHITSLNRRNTCWEALSNQRRIWQFCLLPISTLITLKLRGAISNYLTSHSRHIIGICFNNQAHVFRPSSAWSLWLLFSGSPCCNGLVSFTLQPTCLHQTLNLKALSNSPHILSIYIDLTIFHLSFPWI